MEIHYKDFKGSELLDIRIPSSSSHPEEVVHKSVMAKINNSRSLDTPPAEKPLINKIVFFSLAGIAIILAVVSWYYLLKYFLKF